MAQSALVNVSEQTRPTIPVPALPSRPAKRTRKALKSQIETAKALALAAIAQGHSQVEAAKLAHVSAVSVNRWVQQAKKAGTDLSRERALNLLSQKIESPDTAPQYVTPMVNLLAELNGWKAKREEKVILKPMSDLFNAWQSEQLKQPHRIETNAQVDISTLIGPCAEGETVAAAADQAAKAPGSPPEGT